MNKIINEYLKTGIEPLPNSSYGEGYRCSIYLKDNTYLPCVILRKSDAITKLALRRFEDVKKGKGAFGPGDPYENIVKHFVTSGNRVNEYDIARIEPSIYAIPLELLNQIEGETTMGWTGFVFEMRDGKFITLGTTFGFEFFDIPEEYSFADVVAIHNHSYVSSSGELRPLKEGYSEAPVDYDALSVRRERPYFVCYMDI